LKTSPDRFNSQKVLWNAKFFIRGALKPVTIEASSIGMTMRILSFYPFFLARELISFIEILPSNGIWIHLTNCAVMEIQISEETGFANYCINIGLAVIRDPRELFERVGPTWRRGLITNFDYILALNILTGRNLSRLSNYPVFPGIHESEFGRSEPCQVDFSTWFDGSNRKNGNCVPPEFYGSIELEGLEVIEARMALESKNVSGWVADTFGCVCQKKFGPIKSSQAGRPEGRRLVTIGVDRAGLIECGLLFVMTEGTQFQVFKFDWKRGLSKSPIVVDVSYSRDLVIHCGENFAIGCDNRIGMILTIDSEGKILRQTVQLFLTAISGFGRTVIFVIDYSDVFIVRFSEFPNNGRFLFSEIEGIDRIVADRMTGNLIVLTKSGKIKVRSIITTEVFGEIDFKGETVKTILVTKSWHLIIIECDMTWYIATLRGKIIKEEQVFKQIAVAVTFPGLYGEDYVAFVDKEKILRIVNPLHLEDLQTLGKIKGEAVVIDYVQKYQLVVVIDNVGVLTTFRFPMESGNSERVFEHQ
jgi:hypothetical protein